MAVGGQERVGEMMGGIFPCMVASIGDFSSVLYIIPVNMAYHGYLCQMLSKSIVNSQLGPQTGVD